MTLSKNPFICENKVKKIKKGKKMINDEQWNKKANISICHKANILRVIQAVGQLGGWVVGQFK